LEKRDSFDLSLETGRRAESEKRKGKDEKRGRVDSIWKEEIGVKQGGGKGGQPNKNGR